ncbi:hypothetical protein EGW08_008505 [Elysia chlorotica]|uniref:Uncharacterized protein n=1 Tax=Elysia chlorotica TaxID=188477 RepID=A0A433TQA7_ELYCH|nr:hypothetical protein EGW08_008505 [Elysia chlorotica]
MLLDIKELGDRKPSEVMDKMLALLGHHRPCFLFHNILSRLLPEAIRAPLANSSNISDYRALAKEADNLYNSLTTNVKSFRGEEITVTNSLTPMYYSATANEVACRSVGNRLYLLVPPQVRIKCQTMHQPLQTFSNFQTKRKPGKRESGPALDCQSVGPLCFAATRPTSEPKISQLRRTTLDDNLRLRLTTDKSRKGRQVRLPVRFQ